MAVQQGSRPLPRWGGGLGATNLRGDGPSRNGCGNELARRASRRGLGQGRRVTAGVTPDGMSTVRNAFLTLGEPEVDRSAPIEEQVRAFRDPCFTDRRKYERSGGCGARGVAGDLLEHHLGRLSRDH